MTARRFTTKEEVLYQLNKLYKESQDLATKKEDAEYELLHLKEKYEKLLEENEQLKQQLQSILKLTKKIEDCTHDMKLIGDVK